MKIDKINNINNAKIKYILSTLDNQIAEGKEELDLNLKDYNFIVNELKEIFDLTSKVIYKGHIIKFVF